MSSSFSYVVQVNPEIYVPEPGPSGASAYTIAVEQGFAGNVSAWLASLQGIQGLSAYQVWLAQGNTGTVNDFFSALTGESAYESWLDAGNSGNLTAFLASLVGPSAYQIWLQSGNSGTEQQFLASLIGPIGSSGYSAYTIAVQNGFSGSPSQWLTSLRGSTGPSGSNSWSALTGVPATFPPTPSTTWPIGNITGLSSALAGTASGSTQVVAADSLTGGGFLSGNITITLVNDAANPGNSKFYSTNASGNRGWRAYGTAALLNANSSGNASTVQVVTGIDSRLSNARIPLAHGLTHGPSGTDPITITRAQISDFPGIATTSAPGLLTNLPSSGGTGLFLRGDGIFSTVTATSIAWADVLAPPLSSATAPGLLQQLNATRSSPSSGGQTQVWLRGDNTWVTQPQTTFSSAPFNIPAVNSSASVPISPSASWPQINSTVYFTDGTTNGFLEISGVSPASPPYSSLTLTNRNYVINNPIGTHVGSGAEIVLCSPSLATSTNAGFLPPLSGNISTLFRGDGTFTNSLGGNFTVAYAPSVPVGSTGSGMLILDNLSNGNNSPSLVFNYRNVANPTLLQLYANANGLSTITGSGPGGIIISPAGYPALATISQPGAAPALVSPGSGVGQQTSVYLRGDNSWSGISGISLATTSNSGTVPPLVTPGSGVGQQTSVFLRGDNSWQGVPSILATASSPGDIPALTTASAGETSYFLRGDNTWTNLPEVSYSSSGFTVPAVGSSVTISIYSGNWPNVGGLLYYSDGTHRGFLQITGFSSNNITAVNEGQGTVGATVGTNALLRLSAPSSTPSGAIISHAGFTAPAGWLLCDGTSYAKATYPNLFAAITLTVNGTTANGNPAITGIASTAGMGKGMFVTGTGIPAGATITNVNSSTQITLSANATASGTVTLVVAPHGGVTSTNFQVPDFRGQVIIGAGSGAGLTSRVSGSYVGGSETVALSIANLPSHSHTATVTDPGHNHGITDPGHNHVVSLNAANYAQGGGSGVVIGGGSTEYNTANSITGISINSRTTGVTVSNASVGSGNSFNTMPPFGCANHLIKI
jgi:microcystin-dependent protein